MISLRNSLKYLCTRSCCTSVPVSFTYRTSAAIKHGCPQRCFSVSPPGAQQRQEKSYPPNNSLKLVNVHNRNPRNLEKLRIGDRPEGWDLDAPGKCHWNKLMLEISSKHVKAKIQHFSGIISVRASTNEWCIRKQLYSTKDATAVETIGRVLAQRCLEAGVLEIATYFTPEDLSKEKIKSFIKAMEEAGLNLHEPTPLDRLERIDLNYPTIQEKAWEVFEELDEKFLSKIDNANSTKSMSSSVPISN